MLIPVHLPTDSIDALVHLASTPIQPTIRPTAPPTAPAPVAQPRPIPEPALFSAEYSAEIFARRTRVVLALQAEQAALVTALSDQRRVGGRA
jgi:hypothetical protein